MKISIPRSEMNRIERSLARKLAHTKNRARFYRRRAEDCDALLRFLAAKEGIDPRDFIERLDAERLKSIGSEGGCVALSGDDRN